MADLSDVQERLAEICAAAIYPSGAAQPSVIGASARIAPGWPVSANLDADLAKGIVNVTIFPVRGTVANTYQVLEPAGVLVPAVHGVSASVIGSSITFSGGPSATEYVTLQIGHHSYSRGGATLSALLAALLADIQVDYPSATLVGSTLTIPNQSGFIVRSGAQATLVETIRRISQPFMITVWAASPALRSTTGDLLTRTLVNSTRVYLADTSQMRCVFSRTDEWDNRENALLYRRDLVFNVDYAVTQQFTGYEVTTITTQRQEPP